MSYLDLIEAKNNGCFDLLDEQSKLPSPRPENFTTEVHNRNKGHPRLDVKQTNSFFQNLIIHFFSFSFRENQNYEHHVKSVMMKVS